MEQLNNLDVTFLIIIGISALVGIARGMTKEILSITGWVLAAAAVFYIVPLLNPMMEQHIASKILASVVSGMIVLIVFSLIWVLTVDKIASIIRLSKLSYLDRLFGFMFGAARGIVIVILVALMVNTLLPEEAKKGVFAESQYFEIASQNAEPLKELIPESWIERFKAKTESLGFGNKEQKKESTEVATDDAKDADKNNSAESKTEEQNPTKAVSAVQEVKENIEKIGSNLDVLQQSGEALFNQLAQPKTSQVSDENGNIVSQESASDLDMLLDVLEDNMVVTDEQTEEIKSETQKINDKILEKLDNSDMGL